MPSFHRRTSLDPRCTAPADRGLVRAPYSEVDVHGENDRQRGRQRGRWSKGNDSRSEIEPIGLCGFEHTHTHRLMCICDDEKVAVACFGEADSYIMDAAASRVLRNRRVPPVHR